MTIGRNHRVDVGGEKAGERFQHPDHRAEEIEKVKQAVLDSFGSALQLVQLTVGPPSPIAAAPAAAPVDAAKPKDESTTSNDRFAGGRQYELKFNLPQSASMISTSLGNVLQ